tara:strand:- start:4170 stop:4577 length:408 start_codon:yes stop_codon:yes gene_type:complete
MNRLFSSIPKCPIIITKNAWKKMNEITQKKKAIGFLFSAISGGCNGFNYNLKLLDKASYTKIYDTTKSSIKPTLIEENNTKLLIDPMSEMFLLGTTIDYIYEDYDKGIFENKFIFIPDKNLATSCGCGISFNPKS